MKTSRVLWWASLLLSILLLAFELAPWAAPVLLLGALGAWGGRRYPVVSSLVFAGSLAAAGTCAVAGAPPGLTLLAVAAAVTAWDLAGFLLRMDPPDPAQAEMQTRLETRHLRRLLLVDLAGLALGGLGLALRPNLSFIALVLLALALVLALSFSLRLKEKP